MSKVQSFPPPLPVNVERLKFEPCEHCKKYDNSHIDAGCAQDKHYVEYGPQHYNHFKVGDSWYIVRQKFAEDLCSFVEVTDAMYIQGAVYRIASNRNNITRIDVLTDLFVLLKKQGVTHDQLISRFGEEQVKRMTGRVFKELVHRK